MLSPEPAMEACKRGLVHSIETFGASDGPGMRFVAFLQGCNMRCKYCHNPETWATCSGEWKAEEWTAKELFEKAYRYRDYWGKNMSKGGITLSGGEPLLQMGFATEFFSLAKERGVHTALDTSGQPFEATGEYLAEFDPLTEKTDLFLLDIKAYDSRLHKKLTGFGNENILEMARYLSEKGKPMWIRRVLVPGVTDDEADLESTGNFIKTLKTVEKVQILPYHTLGIFKWERLGLKYPLEGVKAPGDEDMAKAKKLLGIE